ncbi:MAG: DUF4128 domain-containing protein [Alphaproteobacteria bacterium]|nr:DUF4128 domain-containing protein [Alphaproteobacteria bacterium]MBU0796283.1 DUF4128 domain-containing protein [Alphaproteobacteria bacterium]MBU0887238.1 DUF4128 domain-containing protein [Alphaproteobacteria bacterium]MBU1812234.1 DUF4128 domain-containing protein [Alphaproteobacteria bacterium]
MNLQDIRRAVQAHFAEGWGAETPIAWDNLAASPATARAPWVRLSLSGSAGRQVTLGVAGNRVFRRRGHVFVQIFTPLNTGPDRAATLADRAAALLEGAALDGIIFTAADIRQTGEDGQGWWLTMLAVPYQADSVV